MRGFSGQFAERHLRRRKTEIQDKFSFLDIRCPIQFTALSIFRRFAGIIDTASHQRVKEHQLLFKRHRQFTASTFQRFNLPNFGGIRL